MSNRSTTPPASARRDRAPLRTAACAALLLSVPVMSLGGAALAHAATPPVSATAASQDGSYQQSVKKDGDDVTFTFTLDKPAAYVDVHFTPDGGTLQGVRMDHNADMTTWTVTRPVTTAKFTYSFLYNEGGADLPATPTWDQDGVPVTPVTPPDSKGGFPLEFAGDQNYWVTVIGQQTPGHYSYVQPDGTPLPVTQQQPTGAAASGMSYKLGTGVPGGRFQLPSHLEGGRVFISDKPMQMAPATVGDQPSDTGVALPDLNNPQDPNRNTKYDFFEFTFNNGKVAWGGNTTQVDGFSIPMTAELKQDSSGFDAKVGIADKTTQQVVDAYKKSVDGPFLQLVNASGTHITAPRSAKEFQPGQPGGDYFDSAVDSAWAKWAAPSGGTSKQYPFRLQDGNVLYQGSTDPSTGRLTFNKTQNGTVLANGTVDKPSTADVAACAGNLAKGSDADKFVEAHLCAAFNRGIATNDPSTWNDPSTYYKTGPFNEYAAFFHTIALEGTTPDGKKYNPAYGFAYDDVNNQSSVMILPNKEAPTSLTLTLGG